MSASADIRPARPGDLATLQSWLAAEGLPTDDLTPELMQAFLVLSGHGAPVGMIGLEAYGGVGLLRSLVVTEAARGVGAGRALVDALEAKAVAQGVSELWLLTIDADRWFARQGYRTRDRGAAPQAIRNTREFSGLCPGDAVLMSKAL